MSAAVGELAVVGFGPVRPGGDGWLLPVIAPGKVGGVRHRGGVMSRAASPRRRTTAAGARSRCRSRPANRGGVIGDRQLAAGEPGPV
jgi:hypothetical protein